MNSTAIIDFTSAVFLGIILARYLADKSREKNFGQLVLCMNLIFILICDGLPSCYCKAIRAMDIRNNHGAERLYLRNGFIHSGRRNHITGKLDEVEYIYMK